MSNTYTAEEVSAHNHEKDLWIVMNGGVYNLTKFLQEHPGGEEVLISLGGQDGTTCFDDIGHSHEAVQLRENYKIGTLSGSLPSSLENTSDANTPTTDDDNWEYEAPNNKTSAWLPITIAAGVGVYALIFYYFWYS